MNVLNLTALSVEEIKVLNEISIEIKVPFNKLINQIFQKTDNTIDWLVDVTLSRNSYLSSLFLNCCYLAFLKKAIQENKQVKKIIVPTHTLKKVIDNYIKKQNLIIEVVSTETWKSRFKTWMQPYYDFLLNVFLFVQMWWAKDAKRQRNISTTQKLTLLDTFFLKNSFARGQYKDRYYKGILDSLTAQERKCVFYVPQFLAKMGFSKQSKQAQNNKKEQFILKHDFLKPRDYLFALTRFFRIKRLNFQSFTFQDFSITPLLKKDFSQHIYNLSSLTGLLNYCFVKRLKEKNVQLRLVVDWFENQVIDRGLNKGLQEFYPNTKTIGYQGYLISLDYNFYIQPTDFEIRAGIIPTTIATVGKGLVPMIANGQRKLSVDFAPAFRFQSVWNPFKRSDKKEQVVLVALSISLKESYEVVKLVLNAFQQKELSNIKVHLKPHPALQIQKLKSLFNNNFPDNFHFVEGSFKDRIEESILMIGNTSSTCMETLAMGIPVIIAGSQSGLTQNPIPKNITSDIWQLCYTPEELAKAITYYMNQTEEDKARYQKIGEQIRNDYFEPVTREGVRRFLQLD